MVSQNIIIKTLLLLDLGSDEWTDTLTIEISLMESNAKIGSNELLAIVRKHYPNERVLRVEDLSTGCDHWIYCLTISQTNANECSTQSTQIITRFPRKLSQSDCPAMHLPRLQAYVLEILAQNSIPAPMLLHLSDTYLIESYLKDIDLSKARISDGKELKQIFTKIGYYVKKIHSIDCCQKFAYIADIDTNTGKLIGINDKWIYLFENEFPVNLKTCLNMKLIDEKGFEDLEELFVQTKPYLDSYSEPKLLHSDICANNIRVLFDLKQNIYKFNGFIDFADCMAGDPMFDLGELLVSCFGDYSVIDMFECGYGLLSTQHKKMIRFYGIYYNIWLLSSSVLIADTDKWRQTLNKLLYEYNQWIN